MRNDNVTFKFDSCFRMAMKDIEHSVIQQTALARLLFVIILLSEEEEKNRINEKLIHLLISAYERQTGGRRQIHAESRNFGFHSKKRSCLQSHWLFSSFIIAHREDDRVIVSFNNQPLSILAVMAEHVSHINIRTLQFTTSLTHLEEGHRFDNRFFFIIIIIFYFIFIFFSNYKAAAGVRTFK